MGENNILFEQEPQRAPGATSRGAAIPLVEIPCIDVAAGPRASHAWFSKEVLKARVLSPMLEQYVGFKRTFPDCVILFQVGDFFEIFFEDAARIARTINLTLTSRDKSSDDPIPMCGVPIANIETYLSRMVDAGFSCAVVSQVVGQEEPTAKSGVLRKLTRIVTPGVRILSETPGPQADAVCVAIATAGGSGDFSLAATDVSSGEVSVVADVAATDLVLALQRIMPTEVLLPAMHAGSVLDRRSSLVRSVERSLPSVSLKFRSGFLSQSERALSSHTMAELASDITGFSTLSPVAKRAVAGLIEYVDETTVGERVPFRRVTESQTAQHMRIDAMTRQNLELIRNSRDGSTSGTLFAAVNGTVSDPGARLLKRWLVEPLLEPSAIHERLGAVQALKGEPVQSARMREILGRVADVDRIVTRITLGAVSPKELAALREALSASRDISREPALNAPLLEKTLRSIPELSEAQGALQRFLVEDPPWSLSEGGVIRPGVDAQLDRARELKLGNSGWMEAFEKSERQRTGIASLKVRSNNVLGFFIEITRANAAKVPPEYQRRQSTAQAERFTTDELRATEKSFFAAASEAAARERVLFESLVGSLKAHGEDIRDAGQALSTLDVLLGFVEVADAFGWVKPEVDQTASIEIRAGKHPVIASLLQGRFVANDILFGDESGRVLILTGPNMGGKSTYLRQVALISIMAQVGSFVPAQYARLGVVDQVFARIGATDNLAEGESTFMVEMREMAQILRCATRQSLLVIDEVGRGTATADGVSIARAIVEWIVEHINARTLFATHFHELTALSETTGLVSNISVTSIEQGNEVVFTHHIAEGPADRSYGVEVARLAGLPENLLSRAAELLAQAGSASPKLDERESESLKVSKNGLSRAPTKESAQLGLFRDVDTERGNQQELETFELLRARLAALDINHTTPLEALKILSELKAEC